VTFSLYLRFQHSQQPYSCADTLRKDATQLAYLTGISAAEPKLVASLCHSIQLLRVGLLSFPSGAEA
jgi:hypothetical protein